MQMKIIYTSKGLLICNKMKVISMWGDRNLLGNDEAVEGLPVRLIVVLVVGVIALAAMVSALNGFKPEKALSASVIEVGGKEGNMLMISKTGADEVEHNWTCRVKVVDPNGDPIVGASVVVHGLSGAGMAATNKDGEAYLTKTNDVKLHANQNSGYMTLEVTAPGYSDYKNENALVVVRVD